MQYKQGMRGVAVLAAAVPLALSSTVFAAGNPHGTPPGQAKQEASPPAATPTTDAPPAATPSHPAHPAHPATPAKPTTPKAKPVKPAHPSHPATPAKPKVAPTTGTGHGNSAAAPGHNKTTICHATGSATNPYVEITIPPPAIQAHARHQDGRDIIPAPAGGCPTAPTQTSSNPPAGWGGEQQPGVQPPGVQPPAGQTAPATAENGAVAPQVIEHLTNGGVAGTVTPKAATPKASARAKARANGRSRVLGETAHNELGSSTPAKQTQPLKGGLPFTGLDVALVVAAGLGALLAGTALRRRTRSV
jgi:hypothetical protein